MSFLLGITLLAIVTAVACALPGVFIVLRKDSMLVDAISHAVLPGIVVGYAVTRDLGSPLLIVGSALAGLVVVMGGEWLGRTKLLTGDSPQGLIFPALFSAGVILVSLDFAGIHLDTHAVLVGDLNLAAFAQFYLNDVSIGPRYLYVMLGVLGLVAAFITLNYRNLKLATFDPEFATTTGVRTGVLNIAFMFLVSVTVTAAFHAAGAILVLALVVVPAATAHLVTSRLGSMIWVTVALAGGGALAGFWIAYALDAATSAGMALVQGLLFGVVLVGTRVQRRLR